MNLHVIAPGALSTVQDRGREGWRHIGVARAGALDAQAAAVANRLVGNRDHAAVLELTLHGPTLQVPQPVRMAICGAQVAARFGDADGKWTDIPGGRCVELPAGRLQLGALRGGLRAWIGLAGGIDVPVVLGSRSTDLRGGFGGLHGRALRQDDVLALACPPRLDCAAPRMTKWWVEAIDRDRDAVVHFVASGHPAAMRLQDTHWRIGPASNRQGLRLQGDALPVGDGNTISAAVAPGTLQLPPDGKPIVLLADAQTVGGYPRLGHVIAADLPRLAQRRPGERVQFMAIDADAARRLWRARCTQHARLIAAIADRLGGNTADQPCGVRGDCLVSAELPR